MWWPTVPLIRNYIRYAPCNFAKQALWDVFAKHLWWLETVVNAKTTFGTTLCVNAADIVGKYLYYFGTWEPNLTRWIQRRLRPGDLFIDVGANIGYYSLLASRLVGNAGKVVALEALPRIFERLKVNLEANHVQNVRPVNAAAWCREEKLKIFTHPQEPSGTTTLMHEWAAQWGLNAEVEVDAKPLGLLLMQEEIKTARLIKIDVEGAEWNVVSEMRSWLPSCRPDFEIIVEISRSMLEAQGKTGQDLLDMFSSLGYNSYKIKNDYAPSAYIHQQGPFVPKRLRAFPAGGGDQHDVIFSRLDAATL